MATGLTTIRSHACRPGSLCPVLFHPSGVHSCVVPDFNTAQDVLQETFLTVTSEAHEFSLVKGTEQTRHQLPAHY